MPAVVIAFKYEVGHTVSWKSQGQGTVREKVGKIVALLPAHEDAEKVFPPVRGMTKGGQRKFDYSVSRVDRYLVAVPRPRTPLATKAEILDYYAPLASVVHKHGKRVD